MWINMSPLVRTADVCMKEQWHSHRRTYQWFAKFLLRHSFFSLRFLLLIFVDGRLSSVCFLLLTPPLALCISIIIIICFIWPNDQNSSPFCYLGTCASAIVYFRPNDFGVCVYSICGSLIHSCLILSQYTFFCVSFCMWICYESRIYRIQLQNVVYYLSCDYTDSTIREICTLHIGKTVAWNCQMV